MELDSGALMVWKRVQKEMGAGCEAEDEEVEKAVLNTKHSE